MGSKSRHRTKTPAGVSNFGTLPNDSTSSIGIGKKASIAKNNLYSNQLPILNQPHLGSHKGKQPVRYDQIQDVRKDDQIGWLQWSASFFFSSNQAASTCDTERKVIAHWDPLTNLIYVPTEELEQARKLLWQRGFFGKGNLSRSEPTWKEREQGKEKVRRVREKGGIGEYHLSLLNKHVGWVNFKWSTIDCHLLASRSCGYCTSRSVFSDFEAVSRSTRRSIAYTPEELTALRRKERQAAKIERARLAVRAGTQLPDGIVALGGELEDGDLSASLQGLQTSGNSTGAQIGDTYGEHIPGLIYFKPATRVSDLAEGDKNEKEMQEADEEDIMALEVEQLERFVLSREETFFLAGMMDCLEVRDQNVSALGDSALQVISKRGSHSSFPASMLSSPGCHHSSVLAILSSSSLIPSALSTRFLPSDTPVQFSELDGFSQLPSK